VGDHTISKFAEDFALEYVRLTLSLVLTGRVLIFCRCVARVLPVRTDRYLRSLTAEYVASLKFDQERKDRLNKYAAIQRTRQLNRDFVKLTAQLDDVTAKLQRLRSRD